MPRISGPAIGDNKIHADDKRRCIPFNDVIYVKG